MKVNTFNYIWDEIIADTIRVYCDRLKDNDISKYNVELQDISKLKKRVFYSYDETRDYLKKYFYDTSEVDYNDENRIDSHKIAACLCYSLIKNKMFRFNLYEGMPIKIVLLNYEFAYMTSLKLVYTTLVSRYIMNGKDELAAKLKDQKTLLAPKTSPGHNSYHEGRIRSLALNDIYGKPFDILAYSDTLFWIEHYNRQILEGTFFPCELK